jgi:hypothetical protein
MLSEEQDKKPLDLPKPVASNLPAESSSTTTVTTTYVKYH